MAERNIKNFNIVPLYYEMKKALPSQLDNEKIYQSLVLAFTSAPIGLHSNNISKTWNSDVFTEGTLEDRRHAIDCIKRLTAYSNYNIDYAKTLYKPDFPRQIKKDIQEFTKQLLPHYFIYAKDKNIKQVRTPNNSIVNRLHTLIPNPRLRCTYMNDDGKRKALGIPDYHLLMTNPDLEVEVFTHRNGRICEIDEYNRRTNPVVWKYNELASKYGYKISAVDENIELQYIPRDVIYKSNQKQIAIYGHILREVKEELSQFGNTDDEIADILVKYLYGIKKSKNKDLLWACYGEYLYKNLEQKVKSPTKEIQCIDCGEWFEVLQKDSRTNRCSKCYEEYRRNYYKENKRKQRLSMLSTDQLK